MVKWNSLQTLEELEVIDTISENQHVLIFKHSTRCSISDIAKHRLENDEVFYTLSTKNYYLDLISFRNISNELSNRYNVIHQSPQVLLIYKSKCIKDLSHLDISTTIISSIVNATK